MLGGKAFLKSNAKVEDVLLCIIVFLLIEPLIIWIMGRFAAPLSQVLYVTTFLVVALLAIAFLKLISSNSDVRSHNQRPLFPKIAVSAAIFLYLIFWVAAACWLPLFAWDAMTYWGLMAREFYSWNSIPELQTAYPLIYGQNTALYPIFMGKVSAMLGYADVQRLFLGFQPMVLHWVTFLYAYTVIRSFQLPKAVTLAVLVPGFTAPLVESGVLIYGYPDIVVYDAIWTLFLITYRTIALGTAAPFVACALLAFAAVLFKIHAIPAVLVSAAAMAFADRIYRRKSLVALSVAVLSGLTYLVLQEKTFSGVYLLAFDDMLEHWRRHDVFALSLQNFELKRIVMAYFSFQSFSTLFMAFVLIIFFSVTGVPQSVKHNRPFPLFALLYFLAYFSLMLFSTYYAANFDTVFSRHSLYLLPALYILLLHHLLYVAVK